MDSSGVNPMRIGTAARRSSGVRAVMVDDASGRLGNGLGTGLGNGLGNGLGIEVVITPLSSPCRQ